MFGGIFHMTMGMDMVGQSVGCPFMSTQDELCSMTLDEHISAWQSTFTSIVPGLTLLLVALASAVILVAIAPNLLSRSLYTHLAIAREIRERVYTFSYRPLQELFSNGILHPKLF
tara:strand:+ start:6285 stop:6629 length:345 start_codon:yes stop_codon:yes gene_type:complete